MQVHTQTQQDTTLLCSYTHTLESHVNDTPKRHDMTWPIIRTAVRCLLALSEWSPWKGEWRSAISAIRWKALTRKGQKKGFVCIKLWPHNGQFFSGINFFRMKRHYDNGLWLLKVQPIWCLKCFWYFFFSFWPIPQSYECVSVDKSGLRCGWTCGNWQYILYVQVLTINTHLISEKSIYIHIRLSGIRGYVWTFWAQWPIGDITTWHRGDRFVHFYSWRNMTK